MTRLPLPAGPTDNGDQVARQRRKRAAALLERSVAGFDELTLEDVVRSVLAASDEAKSALDVEQFLTDRGHGWQTIEMVQTCLTFVDRYEPSLLPPTPGRLVACPSDSTRNRRPAMAIGSTDSDEEALALRTQSKSFAKIAESLGLGRADDANEAFNRALRRRPLEEQATIRAAENARLDRLQRAVTADEKRTKEDIDRRLRAVERLRTRLMSD